MKPENHIHKCEYCKLDFLCSWSSCGEVKQVCDECVMSYAKSHNLTYVEARETLEGGGSNEN